MLFNELEGCSGRLSACSGSVRQEAKSLDARQKASFSDKKNYNSQTSTCSSIEKVNRQFCHHQHHGVSRRSVTSQKLQPVIPMWSEFEYR
jgi:ABC-type cobalamin transport system ATPase subunit